MCAVTVGTDVYSCEVRIHLLTPLGVGNEHSHLYTDNFDFHMYSVPLARTKPVRLCTLATNAAIDATLQLERRPLGDITNTY